MATFNKDGTISFVDGKSQLRYKIQSPKANLTADVKCDVKNPVNWIGNNTVDLNRLTILNPDADTGTYDHLGTVPGGNPYDRQWIVKSIDNVSSDTVRTAMILGLDSTVIRSHIPDRFYVPPGSFKLVVAKENNWWSNQVTLLIRESHTKKGSVVPHYVPTDKIITILTPGPTFPDGYVGPSMASYSDQLTYPKDPTDQHILHISRALYNAESDSHYTGKQLIEIPRPRTISPMNLWAPKVTCTSIGVIKDMPFSSKITVTYSDSDDNKNPQNFYFDGSVTSVSLQRHTAVISFNPEYITLNPGETKTVTINFGQVHQAMSSGYPFEIKYNVCLPNGKQVGGSWGRVTG